MGDNKPCTTVEQLYTEKNVFFVLSSYIVCVSSITHVLMLVHTHALPRTHIHARAHVRLHADTHARTRAHSQNTRIFTHTYTNTHTHTHTKSNRNGVKSTKGVKRFMDDVTHSQGHNNRLPVPDRVRASGTGALTDGQRCRWCFEFWLAFCQLQIVVSHTVLNARFKCLMSIRQSDPWQSEERQEEALTVVCKQLCDNSVSLYHPRRR